MLLTGIIMPPSGWERMQSALHPMTAGAERVTTLWWIMAAAAVFILVLVMGLALYAMFSRRERRNPHIGMHFVRIGGFAFPVVVLTALLVYVLDVGRALTQPAPSDALRVEVIGKQWWWEVRYPDETGALAVRAANELHLPAGRPVEITLRASDVIHSFWVPNLAGKLDMIPGHVNRLVLGGAKEGIYRGQCAEYCGLQHALMAFYVVVKPPEAFARWLEAQRQPARSEILPILAQGRQAFLEAGCGACHAVRGTPAEGTLGPDLTHVGSRLSLAAGSLGNETGYLAGWIAGSQHLKPGNAMPSFDQLDGPTLRAIAMWLESLK